MQASSRPGVLEAGAAVVVAGAFEVVEGTAVVICMVAGTAVVIAGAFVVVVGAAVVICTLKQEFRNADLVRTLCGRSLHGKRCQHCARPVSESKSGRSVHWEACSPNKTSIRLTPKRLFSCCSLRPDAEADVGCSCCTLHLQQAGKVSCCRLRCRLLQPLL